MSAHPTDRQPDEPSAARATASADTAEVDPSPGTPAGPGRTDPPAPPESTESPDPPEPPDEDRIGVTGTQVAASSLASVSAAFVASFFGVAGTIVGAAVVSIVATVGSAAYSLGLRRTRRRLAQVQLQKLRLTRTVPRLDGGVSPVAGADGPHDGASDDGWRGWLAQRRWGVAAGVAIVFVSSLVMVTLVEVASDRPLSGETGGARSTSIGALLTGGGDDEGDDRDGPVTTEPSTDSPPPAVADEGADDGADTDDTDDGADAGDAETDTDAGGGTGGGVAPPPSTVPPADGAPSPTAPPAAAPGPTTAVPQDEGAPAGG